MRDFPENKPKSRPFSLGPSDFCGTAIIEPDFVIEILGHKINNKRTYKFMMVKVSMELAIRHLNTLLSITEKGDKDKQSSVLKLNEIVISMDIATHILDELAIP